MARLDIQFARRSDSSPVTGTLAGAGNHRETAMLATKGESGGRGVSSSLGQSTNIQYACFAPHWTNVGTTARLSLV